LVVLEGPHIGITILRASHNTVGLRGPINASHELIVLLQNDILFPTAATFLVDVDLVVIGAKGELCCL